jgi:hypothetical protein
MEERRMPMDESNEYKQISQEITEDEEVKLGDKRVGNKIYPKRLGPEKRRVWPATRQQWAGFLQYTS